MDEKIVNVQFMNKAASRINERLRERYSTSLLRENSTFDGKRCHFEPFDKQIIKTSSDFSTLIMMLNDDRKEALSMEKIIDNHLDTGVKKLYRVHYEKVRRFDHDPDASSVTDRSLLSEIPTLKDTGFISIEVKRQFWFGMPAIAIFINDVTKKIISQINERKNKEEVEQAQ